MTVGCASEYLGTGYRQYTEDESRWCSHCNRIFCLAHAIDHKRRTKKARLHTMDVEPK